MTQDEKTRNAPTSDAPAIQPLQPRELAKDGMESMPWGHEILCADLGFATLKRLEMRKNHAGAYQWHREKHEAFVVHSGMVEVTSPGGTFVIGAGQGFAIPPGAPHKVRALTDAILYEVSNAVYNDRVTYEGP